VWQEKPGENQFKNMKRILLWPIRWVTGQRNKLFWHWQQYQRERKCYGFYQWMIQRHGPARSEFGEWSWRINGILCTVWTGPMRLKVYHCGGTQTAHYELTDPLGVERAKQEIETIEKCTRANDAIKSK